MQYFQITDQNEPLWFRCEMGNFQVSIRSVYYNDRYWGMTLTKKEYLQNNVTVATLGDYVVLQDNNMVFCNPEEFTNKFGMETNHGNEL